MVSINDLNELEWIENEFSKEKYFYDGDSNPWDSTTWTHFYFGATDRDVEGEWKWLDGSNFGLENFSGYGTNVTEVEDYLFAILNHSGEHI